MAQAYQELQRVQQTTVSLSQSLQQQVAHLQKQLADQEAAHTAALAEQQQRAAALEREKQVIIIIHSYMYVVLSCCAGNKVDVDLELGPWVGLSSTHRVAVP